MLRDLFGKKRKTSESDDPKGDLTTVKYQTLTPNCAVCKKTTADHRFAQIASTVINEENKPRVLALYEHVKKHEWNALTRFKDFRSDLDDVIVFAIRGPHSGGMVVLFRDPTDLWDAAETYLEETVTDDELAVISQLVSESEWREL
jgi:hypothetical protein